MQQVWIRARDVPSMYGICRTKAYGLLGEFTSQADPKDYIKDGKVLIVKTESFENWWRNRGKK